MDEFLSPIGSKHPNAHLNDTSKSVPEEKQDDFEEGTEQIPLPSKGFFYAPPYFQRDHINVRALDWRDEDILTTKKFIDEGTVFDKTVTNVIQDRDLSAYKLVPVDRDTILLWLRSNAIGKDMEVEYICSNCGRQNKATWDLSTFKIPEYKPEHLEELMEKGEIRIVTPKQDVVVYLRVPLIEESRDTEKRYLKEKEKNNTENDMLGTISLSLVVSGVEVEPGKIVRRKKEILDYFKKIRLSIGDSRYIRAKANEINLRYDTKKDLVCSNKECGYVQEGVEMPIVHQNFLWLDGLA